VCFNVFSRPLSIFQELYAMIVSFDYQIITFGTYNNNQGLAILESYSWSFQTASKNVHVGKTETECLDFYRHKT